MAAAEAEKPAQSSVFSDSTPAINSLFGEILDWLLAPLLLVWPISIAATHHIAEGIANQAYDHVLAEHITRIAREMKPGANGMVVSLPAAPTPDPDDDADHLYFQVATDAGEVLAGTPEVPALRSVAKQPGGVVLFRDGDIMGESVRIAYQIIPAQADAPAVLIQAAETRKQRKTLSSRIISGVLLPQFAVIPLAVILVWVGLTRGLAPLVRLQARIRERRPDDLSPIHLRTVPEELQPVIAAFNHLMTRLQDNLDAQQRFISAAAHQLKTPLTGLKTQTELALRETDCVQLHAYLLRIATGVDRAAHLANQLLQLARAEASHENTHVMEEIDLDALAREVTTRCVGRALEKNIDLGFEEAGRALKIAGVPLLLCEMIDNLIDNAIKYTPSGGQVNVRLRPAIEPILEIEDSGIGIAIEDRTRIFERFYRVLGTDAQGSGLGLAIVREIADLHGTRIEVLDNPAGPGVLIRLVFTRIQEPAHRFAPPRSPEPTA